MPLLYPASSPRQKVLNLDTEGYKTPNVYALLTQRQEKKCQALVLNIFCVLAPPPKELNLLPFPLMPRDEDFASITFTIFFFF